MSLSIFGWHALRYSAGREIPGIQPRPAEYLRACHPGARPGWTRAELVVAVAIILTAAGLVATFVFRSRAPALRIECGMHLQNVGMAFQAFHDERKTLPASCIAPGFATWAVQIAPFLPREQGRRLKDWDVSLSYYDQQEEVRQSAGLALLLPGPADDGTAQHQRRFACGH